MGSTGSKPNNVTSKSKKVTEINEKQCAKGRANTLNAFEGTKSRYEDEYTKLEQDHQKLQNEFLELKAKYDAEIMNIGDFAAHSAEIRRKLNHALFERSVDTNNTTESSSNKDVKERKMSEGCSLFEKDEKEIAGNTDQLKYKEHVGQLQMELDKTLAINKNLQRELDAEKLKFEQQSNAIKEEFTAKALLLCERYEDEKKEINSIWENKLTAPFSEVINNCNQDITTFRAKLTREKATLEEKLENAMSELSALDNKNKLLSHLLEDIRSRYESRESRTEDLERIADLEAQLITQAEELEKQKDLYENMKALRHASSNSDSSSRNRRNKKKKRSAEAAMKRESTVSSI